MDCIEYMSYSSAVSCIFVVTATVKYDSCENYKQLELFIQTHFSFFFRIYDLLIFPTNIKSQKLLFPDKI